MSDESSSLRARARVHAALGDPARLAIVDALTLGDAAPGEIGQALGLPTNLVAHHLKVLREAGLIARSRSEGDRRRTYVRLQPHVLASLSPPPLPRVERVVFVCTHNSARSQLAAALWHRRIGGAVASAGTKPAARVHPRAVKVAHRHGLELDPAGTTGHHAVARRCGASTAAELDRDGARARRPDFDLRSRLRSALQPRRVRRRLVSGAPRRNRPVRH
nr:helix-turn-helix domain-containing protein [Actinoplanes polyasparticus]